MEPVGRHFKIETLGAVDGPGLRFVLFLQGCPLRCPYCHNPESWAMAGGEAITVPQVLARVERYRSFYRDGGLTVSGGEPLVQAEFVVALLARCREAGIHTALDTSGVVLSPMAKQAVLAADLLLLDIKAADPALHQSAFGAPLSAAMETLQWRQTAGLPVWIRHVVAPGLTDSPAQIRQLAELLAPFSCVERVELLPFRRLCTEKYESLGIPFPIGERGEPSDREMASHRAILSERLPNCGIL
ncbi:pyruvate formate lyase-activating protein [Ruminococcaceae bacterium OttesenSCG-928-L11]|nr:pyruvate formate lyase-activating protein [Ruminococcaceae bacterium OttesenSCG-928-L11]